MKNIKICKKMTSATFTVHNIFITILQQRLLVVTDFNLNLLLNYFFVIQTTVCNNLSCRICYENVDIAFLVKKNVFFFLLKSFYKYFINQCSLKAFVNFSLFFWEIIVYSWSTINACSIFSHKWWVLLIKFMVEPTIHVRGGSTYLWYSGST